MKGYTGGKQFLLSLPLYETEPDHELEAQHELPGHRHLRLAWGVRGTLPHLESLFVIQFKELQLR
jgi:hypothetical protein